MIVISGALVLVALVLLVLGVSQSDINLVYGCIVVSLVSLVFLVLGIVQRRGEVLPGMSKTAEPGPGSATATTGAPASSRRTSGDVGDHDDPDAADDLRDADGPDAEMDGNAVARGGADGPAPAVAGAVLVVANRPRYHVDGCRYLAEKQAQEVDVVDAREAGFTACGVCKPDARLGATAGEPPVGFATDDPRPDDAPEETLGGEGSSRLDVAPDIQAAAPASVPATADGSVPSSAGAPAHPAVPPSAAAVPAPTTGQVVVIPDRNRYHRPDCRHVRGTAGAEALEISQARKQGYAACGVCRP